MLGKDASDVAFPGSLRLVIQRVIVYIRPRETCGVFQDNPKPFGRLLLERELRLVGLDEDLDVLGSFQEAKPLLRIK